MVGKGLNGVGRWDDQKQKKTLASCFMLPVLKNQLRYRIATYSPKYAKQSTILN